MKVARLSLAVATILLVSALSSLAASTPLGTAVLRSGNATLNGSTVTLETTIFSGDSLATPADGLAVVQLPLGDQVHFGPATSATLFRDGSGLVVSLERGMIRAHSGKGQRVSVNTQGIVITPSEAGSFEVAIQGGAVVVAARQGAVEVAGTNRFFTIPSGKTMKFETTIETLAKGRVGVGGQAMAPGAAAAIAIAVSAGVAIPVGIAIADAKAKNACEDAIQSVSPSAPTSQC